jgi:hypothetical protein
MFLIVPDARPGYWTAKISDDNMLISWAQGPNKGWTEPPWEKFYMSEYASEFESARRDYESSRLRLEKND